MVTAHRSFNLQVIAVMPNGSTCASPVVHIHRDLFKEICMLYYALVFFIIAIIAAVLGFSGLAAGAAGIAKILFVVFLVIAIATFAVNLLKGR